MSAGLSFDDPRWSILLGGYRMPYDPRNALRMLASDRNSATAWNELWNELHHQGDVGDASYAALPHLVRIYAENGSGDWNTYAIAAVIDEALRSGRNPELPAFLTVDYRMAWQQLAEIGLRELPLAHDRLLIRSIIGVLAIWKGQFDLGTLASGYTQEEVEELMTLANNTGS